MKKLLLLLLLTTGASAQIKTPFGILDVTPPNEKIIYRQVPVVTPTDISLYTTDPAMSAQYKMLQELIGLNNAQVTAILTKYHVELYDTTGKRIYPQ